jgi:hypothetical protein
MQHPCVPGIVKAGGPQSAVPGSAVSAGNLLEMQI